MVGFVCGGAGTIELVLSVAPPWRGQGLATRAVVLAAGWLTRERGTDVVEFRAGRDSRRGAAGEQGRGLLAVVVAG